MKIRAWLCTLPELMWGLCKNIEIHTATSGWDREGSAVPSTLFIRVGNDPGWPCQQMSHGRATESCNVTTYMTSRMPLKDTAPGKWMTTYVRAR